MSAEAKRRRLRAAVALDEGYLRTLREQRVAQGRAGYREAVLYLDRKLAEVERRVAAARARLDAL